MSQLSDRDLRQRDILPPDRLAECRATVIGTGAVGRQVALQLAAIGVPHLQLIDYDTVETVNLAPQGFFADDLGRLKVDCVRDVCRRIHPEIHIEVLPERFRRSTPVGSVLFCCVDSVTTRRHIWEAVKDQVRFFADGRMSAEVIRILAACDSASRSHYPSTLFSQDQAFAGACTAKSTIFTANLAAGFMLEQFARWLRNLPVDADTTVNLLAGEMSVVTHQWT